MLSAARQLWPHLCASLLPRSLGSAAAPPSGMLTKLCSSCLKGKPSTPKSSPLQVEPWLSSFELFSLLDFLAHSHLPTFRCFNAGISSDVFVCWAGEIVETSRGETKGISHTLIPLMLLSVFDSTAYLLLIAIDTWMNPAMVRRYGPIQTSISTSISISVSISTCIFVSMLTSLSVSAYICTYEYISISYQNVYIFLHTGKGFTIKRFVNKLNPCYGMRRIHILLFIWHKHT